MYINKSSLIPFIYSRKWLQGRRVLYSILISFRKATKQISDAGLGRCERGRKLKKIDLWFEQLTPLTEMVKCDALASYTTTKTKNPSSDAVYKAISVIARCCNKCFLKT